MTSNKGKRRNTRKGRAKGGNGGRRSRSAISGYGAHAEAGSCRITTGIHLLEAMRCCSAGFKLLFHLFALFPGARWGLGNALRFWIDGRAGRESERVGCLGATNSKNLYFSFVSPGVRKGKGGRTRMWSDLWKERRTASLWFVYAPVFIAS